MLTPPTDFDNELLTVVEERGDGYSATAEPTVTIPFPTGQTCFLATTRPEDIETIPNGLYGDITNLQRVNDVLRLNHFFLLVNRKLPVGGFYTGCVETSEQVKASILESKPIWIAWPYYVFLFLVKRVLPKFRITKRFYFLITKGRNRMLSKAEVLGRLVCCGFEIVDYQSVGKEMFFVVQKQRVIEGNPSSPCGLLFKTKRIGEGGRATYVYKLRTMHPYAEYLQSHIYEKYNLKENGKFEDDFRIATWGKFLRRIWMDELPMLFNLMKGDLKLFGIRPITDQYLSLYPVELAQRRVTYKPGLVPPFYVDMPRGLDQIIESEMRYMDSYDRSPLITDLVYLFRACYNILVKRARSS